MSAPLQPGDVVELTRRYGLSRTELVPIAQALVRADGDLRLTPGSPLCKRGERADALFVLIEGSLEVLGRDSRNSERLLAEAQAPGVLGHMALMLGGKRTASLRAGQVGARVLRIPLPAFNELVAEVSVEGDCFRRLVLAAELDQHTRAVGDLLRLVDGATDEVVLPAGWSRA